MTKSSIVKVSTNTLLLIMISTCLLFSLTNSQNICSSCVSANNTFTCNNIGCQGFILTQSQNTIQITSQIQCINNQQPCYYSPNAPNVKSVYYYLFCNYTFPGCESCSNSQTCKQCQPGFYSQVYNSQLALYNCGSCGDVIGGCELCESGQYCQQCESEYLNVYGFCYSSQGNIIGSTSKPWNKNGSTPTQIITGVELGLIFLCVSFLLYRFCWKRSKGQRQLSQMMNGNNANRNDNSSVGYNHQQQQH